MKDGIDPRIRSREGEEGMEGKKGEGKGTGPPSSPMVTVRLSVRMGDDLWRVGKDIRMEERRSGRKRRKWSQSRVKSTADNGKRGRIRRGLAKEDGTRKRRREDAGFSFPTANLRWTNEVWPEMCRKERKRV